jgi:hypothetical protein
MKLETSQITARYRKMRSLYLGTPLIKDGTLTALEGVTVLIEDDDSFSATGKLSKTSILTGMAQLYHYLNLAEGMTVSFKVSEDEENTIVIVAPKRDVSAEEEPETVETADEPAIDMSVFAKQGLSHIHIEPFRPENLNKWEPETEPDVYMALGVLQDLTDYRYCCGASKSILKRLGAKYPDSSTPDAILIDARTNEYLMAEWKKNSSDFKSNHLPEDVDVLVCWNDNELDRDLLPPQVLALRDIARVAAEEILDQD